MRSDLGRAAASPLAPQSLLSRSCPPALPTAPTLGRRYRKQEEVPRCAPALEEPQSAVRRRASQAAAWWQAAVAGPQALPDRSQRVVTPAAVGQQAARWAVPPAAVRDCRRPPLRVA